MLVCEVNRLLFLLHAGQSILAVKVYRAIFIADGSDSVLPPPPPRYTIPVAYAAGAANGMAVPVVETNNIISHPEGGCPLQVGEGALQKQKPKY